MPRESPHRDNALTTPDTYAPAWDRLRKLQRRESHAAAAVIVLTSASVLLVPPLTPVVAGGAMIFVMVTSIATTRFRCAHCGSFFHPAGRRRPTRTCDSCGIEIGTPKPFDPAEMRSEDGRT